MTGSRKMGSGGIVMKRGPISGHRLQRSRSHSREYIDTETVHTREGFGEIGTGLSLGKRGNAMSRALRKAARSPFSIEIEKAEMSDRFACPQFNCYDGKTDPIEHVSHYIQMMSLHTHNDALICKLIQEFGVRFVTCNRVPQLVDALLSMKMRAGETLRSYASRYWELYNEIDKDNERVAASTFRMGLPEDSGLRESLTKKPPKGMRQLMRCIEEYKRLEDDRLQSKGKASIMAHPQ
ncbi:uncharacterized protein LOC115961833 [Quercus lobata]|uniref:uncharacterized protein LOC115961833 n=1 Tax=Quercus lobata TaxID=97700 RepID=UPI0012483B29|nr:uncharacterized protein LOC115961833 [Quercus lobata]